MLQMTRRIISDADRQRTARTRSGVGEQLTHISHARCNRDGALVPLGVIMKQVAVLFHDGATARGVRYDVLCAGLLERRDVFSRQCTRALEISGMRMQRAAPSLP